MGNYLYSKGWRLIHLLGIIFIITYFLCCSSLSEPVDLHLNLMHEYEQREKERQEEIDRWERAAEEERNRKHQEEKERQERNKR